MKGKEPDRVWINDRQHVEGLPEAAWRFPIGGYLPAQRWLKDRVGRTLGYEEQAEYQRIIWVQLETQWLRQACSTQCLVGFKMQASFGAKFYQWENGFLR